MLSRNTLAFNIIAFVTIGLFISFGLILISIKFFLDEPLSLFGTNGLFIGLIILGTVFVFIASFVWYLHRLFQPMMCLVTFCKDFSLNPNSLPPCSGSAEINELKNAIIGLLEDNKSLCSKERDIFKEAAHELKTPVAILKSRLALYKKKESYSKEQFIDEAQGDIDKVVQSLRDLLFLKSIEMEMHGKRMDIDIISQCDVLQSVFRPLVEKKQLCIEPIREGSFILNTYEKAIQRVLLAIFENIFMHSKYNSTITVTIKGDARSLVITNEISQDNDDKLFSSKIGSKIIERLSSTLNYEYSTEIQGDIFVTKIHFLDSNTEKYDAKCDITYYI